MADDSSEQQVASIKRTELESVPAYLRIQVIYKDEVVIVVNKPSNLRSVPGHASPAPIEDIRKNKLTAQEAWILAIRSFSKENAAGNPNSEDTASIWLRNLASIPNLSCVPRKFGLFRNYCQKNQRRLGGSWDNDAISTGSRRRLAGTELDTVAEKVHEQIKKRQIPRMNLPESTKDEESAFGQLVLLGYAGTRDGSVQRQLFVVHRLDCETSGVMVFARDEQAASKLAQAWRERDKVTKIYLARVKDWPPFHNEKQVEGKIDEALAPSEERIKWKVQPGGKSSTTLWRLGGQNCSKSATSPGDRNSVILELTPVTGRTHQLRIHCAHVGSGIEGDSLYGADRVEWNPGNPDDQVLCLHAHRLSFPHPRTGEQMTFSSMPSWCK